MSSIIKTKSEIEAMRRGGKILGNILTTLSKKAVAGVSTAFLDTEARRLIKEYGATPSFLGYHPDWTSKVYPAALCTSLNDEIVHSVPSKRVLKDGDIVGLDLGLWFEDACVDSAVTVAVGNIDKKTQKLLDVTYDALYAGIMVIRHGAKTGDIGHAIQTYLEKNGFSVIRDLAGHGVGRKVHEDPAIFNFGKKGVGETIVSGMTLALEPMAAVGRENTKMHSDGWGVKTADGSLTAQFEHTVLVTDDGYEILTEV